MRMPPNDRLTAAAAEAEPVRQLRTFTGWVGSGRTLTQMGRVTLADARELVGLLGTQDRLDPKIGDRVFRTKSSEELPGITTVVTWAKACRLVRVTGGRLVPVQRNAGLLDHPMELWARMFETFPRLGAALCPPGWGSRCCGATSRTASARCWRRWPGAAARSRSPRAAGLLGRR
jgi:hypothetical protein